MILVYIYIYIYMNIYVCVCVCVSVYKRLNVSDCSWGWPEGSFFNSYYTKV